MDFELSNDISTKNKCRMSGIVKAGQGVVLDLGGPAIESLTSSEEDAYCVMKGSLSAGASVPLHSHGDAESFYVLSGEAQVLMQTESGLTWRNLHRGDFAHIHGGTKHAWRNPSAHQFEAIVTTTPKLGQFLRELGHLLRAGGSQSLKELQEISERYGYWSGGHEENAAIGLILFS